MNKKTILVTLGAIGAVVLAMPALASALIPLHLSSTPNGVQPIDAVGVARLSTTGGTVVTCEGVKGAAEFEAGGTTGTLNLTFGGDCTENILGTKCNSTGEPAGSILTTTLPFHLVTLANEKPGVLITPNAATGKFAEFACANGLLPVTLTGNGVIGTIAEPKCKETKSQATLSFTTTATGVQQHTTVAGTSTEYTMLKESENAALEGHSTLTLKEGGVAKNSELVCT